jgi:hexokinase
MSMSSHVAHEVFVSYLEKLFTLSPNDINEMITDFHVEQTNIAAGRLIAWTKGFTAKGVEGEDIIILLNEALRRKNIHGINVVALANDTVGTLVAKSYADPACDLGVILGTGTNACYLEKLSNIRIR